MSDDVFAIRTNFQDVAELGQGYLERADGERILLPLPIEVSEGEGVRFIVYLADGTPAFAGAGRTVQVSDQGTDVSSEERYETLIDGLVFDERSRPVYDYIVAVRQMAYADLGAAAEAEAEAGDETVLESDEPTAHAEAASTALLSDLRSDTAPQPELQHEAISLAPDEDPNEATRVAPGYHADAMDELSESPSEATPADHNAALSFAAEEQARSAAENFESPIEEETALAEPEPADAPRSIMPLATGILRRPSVAAGWHPAAPKRPQPHPGTGHFKYPPGKLPIPARPPRPELRAELRVQPAPSPNAS